MEDAPILSNCCWTLVRTSIYKTIVQLLLNANAQVNIQDDRGVTALMYAAVNGQPDIVRLLLDVGADPNIPSEEEGLTALTMATFRGHLDIVRLLLQAGSTDETNNFSSLITAASKGHSEIIEELLQHDNAYDLGSALTSAAQEGHKDILEMLLAAGAVVNDEIIEETRDAPEEIRDLLVEAQRERLGRVKTRKKLI